MRDRYVAGRQVDQASGNEEGRDTPRPSLLEHHGGLGNAGKAADPGSDHHAGSDLLFVGRRLPTRIVQRLARGTHGKDDEIIDLALLLRLHPLIRVECAVGAVAAWNLASDLSRQVGDIEWFDTPGPAFAVYEPAPRRLHPAGQRRHHAEACDDDASDLRLLGGSPDQTVSRPPGRIKAPPRRDGAICPRNRSSAISFLRFFPGTLSHRPR